MPPPRSRSSIPHELGGPRVHSKNGVCQFVAQDDLDAARLARDLLAHLPAQAGDVSPHGGPANGADG